MAFVAVIGCGPIGGALAHKLALGDRIREIRLIDPHPGMAQGKALDILQSSAIDGFSARVTSAQALQSAAGAAAIAVADSGQTGAEHAGEPGLAMLRQIAAVETTAAIVFTGASQRELIARAIAELHIGRSRVLGTAPAALESALRALAGLAIDGSGADIQLQIVGTPPSPMAIGWEEATASGAPLHSQAPPHALAALSARVPQLWPPGPLSLAAAAARVVEGIVNGARRPYSCFVALEAGPARNSVVAMPVDLGPRGVARVRQPALAPRERTWMETAIELKPF